MTQAGVEVEKAAEVASSTENSRRVCCVSCGHTLLEISVETPEGSRVWMRVKCKSCRAFNVAVLKDGKLTVSATS